MTSTKMCDTCAKEDVCLYKDDMLKEAVAIKANEEVTNLPMDVTITCRKYLGTVTLGKRAANDIKSAMENAEFSLRKGV